MSAEWVSGSVYVDLTDVVEDKARLRVYRALMDCPAGARCVIYVGPLAVNPDVVPVIWEHGRHALIEMSGHGFAVRRWVDALRNGMDAAA